MMGPYIREWVETYNSYFGENWIRVWVRVRVRVRVRVVRGLEG